MAEIRAIQIYEDLANTGILIMKTIAELVSESPTEADRKACADEMAQTLGRIMSTIQTNRYKNGY